MIIGLDLDQTITDLPALFSLVTTVLVEAGHEVHIITCREPDTLGDNQPRRGRSIPRQECGEKA